MKNYVMFSMASFALAIYGIIMDIFIPLIPSELMETPELVSKTTFVFVDIPLFLAFLLFTVSALAWLESVISYAKEMEL